VLFLPYGLVEAEVHRRPWVSMVLGGLCVLVHFFALIAPTPTLSETARAQYEELQALAQEGGFTPGPQCRPILGSKSLKATVTIDDEAERRDLAEQMCAVLFRELDRMRNFAWGYVPSKGKLQIGLITYMFLHGGLMHLLGNMLFFFVCGPFLEDLWGRPVFLAFFLLGGIGGALAHGALDPWSARPLIGASGAVAACMGALTLRYPQRRVKMMLVWFLPPKVIRFRLAVWLWGGFWGLSEVVTQVTGGQPGVATMAHVGGFFFGAAVVVALHRTGIEARFLAPAVENARTLIRGSSHPDVVAGDKALAEERADDAVRLFESALRAHPSDEEAMWGAVRASVAAGSASSQRRAFNRLAKLFVANADSEGAAELVFGYREQLASDVLLPGVASSFAPLIERRDPSLARLMTGSDVALVDPDTFGEPASPAVPYGEAPLPLGAAPAPASTTPSAVSASFVGVGPEGPQVRVGTNVEGFVAEQVRMVAAGLVAGRVVVDMRMDRPGGPRVLRFWADTMGLEHFAAPGMSRADAFAQLMTFLLQTSGAQAVPSVEGCTTGPFTTYRDLTSFEIAVHGQALSPAG
jgi:membrane associated rhomboid family serine protease